jgi:hypothetical protein
MIRRSSSLFTPRTEGIALIHVTCIWLALWKSARSSKPLADRRLLRQTLGCAFLRSATGRCGTRSHASIILPSGGSLQRRRSLGRRPMRRDLSLCLLLSKRPLPPTTRRSRNPSARLAAPTPPPPPRHHQPKPPEMREHADPRCENPRIQPTRVDARGRLFPILDRRPTCGRRRAPETGTDPHAWLLHRDIKVAP